MPFGAVYRLLLLAFLFLSSNAAVFGIGAAIDLPNRDVETAKQLVTKTLDKIDAGYSQEEETQGFAYRFTDSFFTVYDFDIYIGTYGANRTMVRIDTDNRMSYAMADILLQENGHKPFPNTYGSKIWLLGDTLTLITPAFGHLYTNLGSPLSDNSPWLKSFSYLGIDLALLWIGGKTFFTHGFDPLERGRIATAILMGGFRLMTVFPNHLQIVAHNRLVGLGYTFRF